MCKLFRVRKVVRIDTVRLSIFSVDQKMITAPVSQTSEGMDLTIPESERPGGFEAMHKR